MRRSARWPRRERIVGPVLDMGGFQHGHTYAGNPLACAAGLAVLEEIDRLGLIDNAAAMGEVLKGELKGCRSASRSSATCAARACCSAPRSYADPDAKKPLPREANANVAADRPRLSSAG